MTAADQEMLGLFLVEGRELVERASDDLAALGASPDAPSAIDSLFRSLHTLKGSTALFELSALTGLLHAAETRLEVARSAGRLDGAEQVVETLDLTEKWLDALEAGVEPTLDLADRTRRLAAAMQGQVGSAPSTAQWPREAGWAQALAAEAKIQGALVAVRYRPSADAYFRGDDPLAVARALPGLVILKLASSARETAAAYDPFQCRLQIDAVCAAALTEVREALKWVGDEAEAVVVDVSPQRASASGLQTLRVDAARLDAVAALVGELVVAKNALLHEVDLAQAERAGLGRGLANARAALERVVGDLHAGVSDLRLVEIGRLFGRFPRQVREIADGLGKSVEVQVGGEGVSLDKAVVEGLYEPLLHLVRNALDHGIEPLAERQAAGKPAAGMLSLSARASGDEVVVEVADDGRGLDIARIRQTAVGRGVIDTARAAELGEAETAQLIFTAGFSTADKVSDLSGRGVGMDAVRIAVERLGGRVGLDNRPGRGLTVRLSLPARVVLTRVLTVTAGGERFGVPMEAVTELHQVRAAEVTQVRASRAYVRRDTVLPLLRLADLLNLPAAAEPGSFPVLNVRTANAPVGVQIEALGERIVAPLRPLGGLLAGYPGVLGTVMEGDGRVLLVLDVEELAS